MNKTALQSFEILPASDGDFDAIYRLQLAAYATEDALYDYTIPPMLQTLQEAVADCKRSLVLKAVKNGEIVGSVRGYLQDGTCCVNKLMVLSEHRGCGIGTALLAAIENMVSARKYALFTGTKSVKNISMYERNGYAIVRTEPDRELVFMEK